MRLKWLMKILKMIGIGVVASLAFGLIVMALWNALIPALFKGPAVTFWQALGLLLLSHILLRGWGHGRHSHGWGRDRWKQRFEAKLAAMAPEEREKFKAEWRKRCGWPAEESSEKN